MTGYDGSGPQGMGPMTGGARGMCNPATGGYTAGFGPGRGMAYGRGAGRGMRMGFRAGGVTPPFYARPSISELSVLKAQAAAAEKTLAEINSRIAELEKPTE